MQSATPFPLVEPDVQISRLPLSHRLSPQAFAECVAERRSSTQPKRWSCAPAGRLAAGGRAAGYGNGDASAGASPPTRGSSRKRDGES